MKTHKIIGILLFFVCFMLILPESTMAQCSLCKGAVESNMKGGGGLARGLYNGILYLMAFPYLAAAIIAYFWYRNSRKNREKQDRVSSILQKRLKGQI